MFLLLCGASALAPLDEGLTLLKTSFTGGRSVWGASLANFVDVARVPVQIRACDVANMELGGSLFVGRSSRVVVEQTEFRSIRAVATLEVTCASIDADSESNRVSNNNNVQTSYWVKSGGSLYLDNVVFDTVTSDCRKTTFEINDACGGAVWAQSGALMLSVKNCVFRECATGTFSTAVSKEMGAAIMSGASDFVFEGCTVEDCYNQNSIVFFKNTSAAIRIEKAVITDCHFRNVGVGPGNQADHSSMAGGSGFLIANVGDLTLINCEFSQNRKDAAQNIDSDGGALLAWKDDSFGETFRLNLTDCTFVNTSARRAGAVGILKYTTIYGIYVINTVFDTVISMDKNGGAFFCSAAPEELIIRGSTFRNVEAGEGVILYRWDSESGAGLSLTQFEMTETIIDNCRARTSGRPGFCLNVVMKDSYESFAFQNNTFRNLATDAVCISGVNYSQGVELDGWTFDTCTCAKFVLNLGATTGSRLVMKNCILKAVSSDDFFNAHYGGSRFTDMTFENCILEFKSADVSKSFWVDMWAGSAISMTNCVLKGETNAYGAIFRAVATAVTVSDCRVENFVGPDYLFNLYNYEDSKARFSCTKCTVQGGTVLFADFECEAITVTKLAVKDVQIDDSQYYEGFITVSAEQNSTLQFDIFDNVNLPALYLRGGASFTVDGAFKHGPGSYIVVNSPATMTLGQTYACLDKSESEALSLYEGFQKGWDSSSEMFECGVDPLPTSPPSETDSDNVPGESSTGATESSSGQVPDGGPGDDGERGGSGLSSGAVAAIAVVVSLIVIGGVVALLVVLFIRRKKQGSSHEAPGDEMDEECEETRTSFDIEEPRSFSPVGTSVEPISFDFEESGDEQ